LFDHFDDVGGLASFKQTNQDLTPAMAET
jgi:hypothetical protein